MPSPSAERIVTLLPSATEIVCELGLRDRLVGVTHECDYPPGIESLPHVTRSIIDHDATSLEIDTAVREHLESSTALYHLDETLMRDLAPDLIVTQALCEVCAVSEDEVQAIMSRLPGPPRLANLEPMTLFEVFDTITLVGDLAGCPDDAAEFRESLETRVSDVRSKINTIAMENRPTVGFLEWIDPLFNAGHWTPEIIEYAGGVDAFGNKHQPSQTISDDILVASDPDVLIVALCGFDETRAASDLESLKQRIEWDTLKAVKNSRVHILDGNAYFSRPGPRLVESLEILADILH
ncbi:MAG: cobalamin-binding protein [Pseudomonadales bacterium]|nr:cobalamin-binding protein [Pseudomonadales bacterium]MBO6565185.1 cobalamin-binding protein [Pseudomonadales bacterium]MBO6595820.1 cobalamin-binding protein [Pseudomonadales bacterium]MBO6657871.1 cobalamin-binding protein [Pseudomonadales bacterium]MBO6702425.1 cobalamin-binding protein [Pseudomonadales bacterium]